MKQRTDSSRFPRMTWQLERMTHASAYAVSRATRVERVETASWWWPVRERTRPFEYRIHQPPGDPLPAYSKHSMRISN